jgi:perosamine synthetase
MTDIAAAIGLVQLKKLDSFNKKRNENAKKINETIEDMAGLVPPYVQPRTYHVFHQYTVRVDEDFRLSRDQTAGRLNERGIATGVYYPIPIHKQSFYKNKPVNLHVTEKMSGEVLSLPVHPGLKEDDLEKICKSFREL